MTDFLKQDIFFFVTTVAVGVIVILLSILLVYAIRFVRTASYVMDKIKSETDIITSELAELRANIRKEGVKLKHFAKFAGAFTKKRK